MSRKSSCSSSSIFGLSHLIRKSLEPSAQSKRKFILWWWDITPYLPLSWSLSLFSSLTPLKALAICVFTSSLFRVFLFFIVMPRHLPWTMQRFLFNSPTCHFYFNNVSWAFSQGSGVVRNNSSCLLLSTCRVPGTVQSQSCTSIFSFNLDILWGVGAIFIFPWTQVGFEAKSKSKARTWHHALKRDQ